MYLKIINLLEYLYANVLWEELITGIFDFSLMPNTKLLKLLANTPAAVTQRKPSLT